MQWYSCWPDARACGQPELTVQSKTMRHRFTGAIALMALIFTITAMVAPKSMRQTAVTDADYLILNPEMD